MEEYHKKAIKKLLPETIFEIKINKVGTKDEKRNSLLKMVYGIPVINDAMLEEMYFLVKAQEDRLQSIEGIIENDNKEITAYSKTSSIATAITGVWKEAHTSVSSGMKSQVGGIDFTDRAMRMGLEPMGSFADLKLVLPQISNVAAIDLDNEFKQIQIMASSGIRPSDNRILEFAAACYYRGEFGPRLGEITICLQQAHFLDERLGRESSPTLRLATMLPEVLYSSILN